MVHATYMNGIKSDSDLYEIVHPSLDLVFYVCLLERNAEKVYQIEGNPCGLVSYGWSNDLYSWPVECNLCLRPRCKALLNNKFSDNNNDDDDDDDVDQGAKCKITVLVYSIQLCSIVFTIKNSMIIYYMHLVMYFSLSLVLVLKFAFEPCSILDRCTWQLEHNTQQQFLQWHSTCYNWRKERMLLICLTQIKTSNRTSKRMKIPKTRT